MQLLFIRKEIENKTVRESNLFKDAVQVAVSNCLNKRKSQLWKKLVRVADEPPIARSEMDAIVAKLKTDAPWTPWQRKGDAGYGRLRAQR